jgi:formate dehydrogenase subunit delta
MSHTAARLVREANQIARAFARLPHQEAVRNTAEHIRAFWERRMLDQIFVLVESDAHGLQDIARDAVRQVSASQG